MTVYVDDILITSTDIAAIQIIKTHLHDTFSIKDLGKLYYFLVLEVDYVDAGIVLTQFKFIKDLLKELLYDVSKKALTPLSQALKLDSSTGPLLPELKFIDL